METLDDKIITIDRVTGYRAVLLKSILESEGIDCFLSHQNLLQGVVSGGVEIKVRKHDVEKALRILENAKGEHGKSKENAVRGLKSVRRVLVPIDFSEESIKAGLMAIALADKLKAEVKVVHVYYNPVVDFAPSDSAHFNQISLVNYLYEAEQIARKQFKDIIKTFKLNIAENNYNVKLSQLLINGIVDKEIISLIKSYKPGLVVLGAHGIGRKSQGIFGSVSENVIKKTDAPILVTPENYTFNAKKAINNVLFATDFDPNDNVSISKLINLLSPFKTTLHFMHVCIGIKQPWHNAKMDSLKEFVNTEFPNIKVNFEFFVSDDVINGIESYIRQNDIDLVALNKHSRGAISSFFTPSVTNKMLNRIIKPMLIYKVEN